MLLALREQGRGVEFEKVDIAESDSLFERYGLVIPVLCDSQGRELFWPLISKGCAALSRRIDQELFPTRTASTSQLAPCSTPLAVEPNNSVSPCLPWLPTTIRSAFRSSAMA